MHFSADRNAPSLLYCTAEIFRLIFGWEILTVQKKDSCALVFVMREQLSGLVFNRGWGELVFNRGKDELKKNKCILRLHSLNPDFLLFQSSYYTT
jgi:hypothetical protein